MAAQPCFQAHRRAAARLANSTQGFGGVPKRFHWLATLLVLTAIPLVWFANQLPYDTSKEVVRKAFVFWRHKALGVATLFVGAAAVSGR